jgi:predicted nuclease with TOPRIM domain
MTEEWIKANRHLFETLEPTQADLDSIDEDLYYISVAINAMDENNDMLDDYNTFKNELDSDQNDHISADEINNYIDNM